MKKNIIWFSIFGIWLVLSGVESSCFAQPPYRIGPGDVLDIQVWQNQELSSKVAVLPDGKIHVPLLGGIQVKGVLVADLEHYLNRQLNQFVHDPGVTVNVSQANSMMLYIIGKVNNPGRYRINQGLDVMQGLSLAGGFNAFAKKDQVRIFRKVDDKTTLFDFNFPQVSHGKNLEQNIILKRGDIIIVH
ncbi:MAG: polysaccharide export protein [Desulfobacteraceae bacterium]|nr:polysaccharide export protein [Desulfobacteraceae bacterium]